MKKPEIDEALARSAHCWFDVDRVPGDPETTVWKRLARLRQARWRESLQAPVGFQPYGGGEGAAPVGSRVPLEYAEQSGLNFLSKTIRAAVEERERVGEKHQMLSKDRLWANLLSSMPLCFNLFGDLTASSEAAASAVQSWWPDAPKGRVDVRFEHSPGRTDPAFLGNKSAFDVCFEIDIGAGLGVLGVETKYQEHVKSEAVPTDDAMKRYVAVTEASGVFKENWRTVLVGTPLQQIWLDHLLLLSMLQHKSQRWTWGRFVLVYPEENPSFARAAESYRAVLKDPATFEARTIEQLLAFPGVLPDATVAAFKQRYLKVPSAND